MNGSWRIALAPHITRAHNIAKKRHRVISASLASRKAWRNNNISVMKRK
jgi:hypothetical protein